MNTALYPVLGIGMILFASASIFHDLFENTLSPEVSMVAVSAMAILYGMVGIINAIENQ